MPNSCKGLHSRDRRTQQGFRHARKTPGRGGRTGTATASAIVGRFRRRLGTAGADDRDWEHSLRLNGAGNAPACREHTSRRACSRPPAPVAVACQDDVAGASRPRTAARTAKARGPSWQAVRLGAKPPLPVLVRLLALAPCRIDLAQRTRCPSWQRCLACHDSAERSGLCPRTPRLKAGQRPPAADDRQAHGLISERQGQRASNTRPLRSR